MNRFLACAGIILVLAGCSASTHRAAPAPPTAPAPTFGVTAFEARYARRCFFIENRGPDGQPNGQFVQQRCTPFNPHVR